MDTVSPHLGQRCMKPHTLSKKTRTGRNPDTSVRRGVPSAPCWSAGLLTFEASWLVQLSHGGFEDFAVDPKRAPWPIRARSGREEGFASSCLQTIVVEYYPPKGSSHARRSSTRDLDLRPYGQRGKALRQDLCQELKLETLQSAVRGLPAGGDGLIFTGRRSPCPRQWCPSLLRRLLPAPSGMVSG
jgi:hypothetical protein